MSAYARVDSFSILFQGRIKELEEELEAERAMRAKAHGQLVSQLYLAVSSLRVYFSPNVIHTWPLRIWIQVKNTQTCDIMLQLESQVVFLLGREAESRAVTRSGGPQWQTGRSGRSQRHRESCSESKARSLDSCVLNSFKIKQPQT